MKSTMLAGLAALSSVSAHSWLGAGFGNARDLAMWRLMGSSMPWYSYLCQGWPRNKANPGDWIDESTNYAWNLVAQKFTGDTNACHKSNAPMASAAPGGMIRLYYGGNGHARGYNAPSPIGGDPGLVSVYWKGQPEAEIADQKEFTQSNLLQSQGFSADSFSYPADPNIKRPQDGLVDKGNWMELKLPSNMAAGRHMMVWVWSYAGAPQWSTCFDVQISGQDNYQQVSVKVADPPSAPLAVPAAVAPVPPNTDVLNAAAPAVASAVPTLAAPATSTSQSPASDAPRKEALPASSSAVVATSASGLPRGKKQNSACPSRYARNPMANLQQSNNSPTNAQS